MTTKNPQPAQGTKIEWTHIPGYKGETWNPSTGCSHVSAGCKFCYAEREWPRLAGNPKTVYHGREFTDVQVHDERLKQPLRWTKRRAIFVNSMSDLFHAAVPFEFIDKVLAVAALCPQHIFMVLTKRPERMVEYFNSFPRKVYIQDTRWDLAKKYDVSVRYMNWPLPNLWLGVSIEDQATADLRIPPLLKSPAAIRFVSYEPALGAVQFEEIPNGKTLEPVLNPECWGDCDCDGMYGYDPGCTKNGGDGQLTRRIDWVIAGGESGLNARPSHPAWFRQVRDQCAAADVPFFFKQWGEWWPVKDVENEWHPDGLNKQTIYISSSGETCFIDDEDSDIPDEQDSQISLRIGKKLAGSELDGKQYQQFPEVG